MDNFSAAICAAGPQGLVVAAVEHQVAVVLHVQSRSVVPAVSVGGPARVFSVAIVSRVIQDKVSITLNNNVSVALVMGVSCPECHQGVRTVNYEVSIILQNSEVHAVVAGEALASVKHLVHSK